MKKQFQKRAIPVLLFAALLLPSLLYSGQSWYQSLVALKWLFTLVPLGCLALYSAASSFNDDRTFPWSVDQWSLWGIFWLVWSLCQPLWIDVRNVEGWLREQICFVAFWAALWTLRRGLLRRLIPLLLALTGWAGGLSAFQAEAQLWGFYPKLWGVPLVMKVSQGYVGNVGQQNLLAFWLALSLLCSTALMALPWKGRGAPRFWCRVAQAVPFIMASRSLWTTTSRSGIGAFVLALLVLMLLSCRGRHVRTTVRRLSLFLVLFFAMGLFCFGQDSQRGSVMADKWLNMVTQWETLGSRYGIWRSSVMVLLRAPVAGVGLGQFKWHYLEGQKDAMDQWPHQGWQYTQWAHNEVLQWACEFGLVGLVVLLVMAALWLKQLRRKFLAGLPPESCWAVALLVLFAFAGLWTRPLRRPEYVVWLACGLAVANRHLFGPLKSSVMRKTLACLFGVFALWSFWYGWSMILSDRALARVLKITDSQAQVAALEPLVNRLVLRDQALRELARARLRLAEEKLDADMVAQGLNELNEAFMKAPTSSDLRLLSWYGQRHGLKALMKQLEPFGVPPE